MKKLQKASLPIIIIAGAFLSPRFASAGADSVVDSPPPAPRVEHVPHRDGYVCVPGYWERNGRFFSGYRVPMCTNAAGSIGLRVVGTRSEASGITPAVIGSS
jgi:hypothetical protein